MTAHRRALALILVLAALCLVLAALCLGPAAQAWEPLAAEAPAQTVQAPEHRPAPPVDDDRDVDATVATAPAPDRWLWPVQGGRVSSRYRPAHRPEHTGLDIAVELDTLVSAARAGSVEAVSEEPGGYGTYVLLDHGDGMRTLYAHLGRTLVLEGRYVQAGEAVGRVGLTGRTTGPHVHFEVRRDGVRLNPLPYLVGGE